MQNRVIWSFLSLMALGTGALMVGCDSDAALTRSARGESCDKTADCQDGLKCINSVCTGSNGTGGSGNDGDAGAPSISGSGGTPTAPAVLGGEGESCTKRSDCKTGLGCFSQRCQQDEGGEGGEGNVSGPKLGTVGETCGLTSDCQKGLACLPQYDYAGYDVTVKASANSIGVCRPTDNGLEPTGKSCAGAECRSAEDCCELPVEMHATLGANSCAKLADLLDGVDCDAPSAAEKPLCFANSIYCECGSKTWTCDEGGRCLYNAACDPAVTTFAPGGCPTTSRAGYQLYGACSAAKKCEPANEPVCKKDADCVGEATADTLQTCVEGECTCYKETSQCYIKCSEDLDCRIGQMCDTDTSVCVNAGTECTSDAACVVRYNDVNAKCFDGTCDSSCNNDLDCNGGQLTAGDVTRVCNADHRCELVGCHDDSECEGTENGVRLFCTETVPEAVGDGVYSAITD